MILEELLDLGYDEDELKGMVILSDLDSAIIGITSDCRLIYAYDLLVDIFASKMSKEEAIEWIDTNIEGVSFGEKNPIVLHEIGGL